MTDKTYKATAREILVEASNGGGEKPPKFRVNKEDVCIVYNEKGQFFSLQFELEFSQKFDKGEISISRTMLMPINLKADVAVVDVAPATEKKEEEPKKRTRRSAKVEDMTEGEE